MLTGQQFDRTRRLASTLAGIELLVERYRELLHRRSRRLGICSDAGLDALLEAAERWEAIATQTSLLISSGLLILDLTGHLGRQDTCLSRVLMTCARSGRSPLRMKDNPIAP